MSTVESLSAAARAGIALVADATPAGNARLRTIMRDLGFARVVEATDGTTVLDLLAQHQPGILVLDWDLPLVATADILEHVRGSQVAPATPVLLTMASPTRKAVETAVALKAAIVAKPFSAKALRMRLEPLLREAAA